MEERIIDPVPRELLAQEPTPERCLRHTNKRANEIYVVTYQNAPNVVREIGRLREIAFRAAGGGTGKACDLDEFDTMDVPYRQLIVWNPETQEILGGYRYLPGSLFKMGKDGQPLLATSHMFHFSDKFIKEYMPYTVELGRSFVAVEYQSTRPGSRGLFTLDNLLGRAWRADFPGERHEIFLRKNDNVSLVRPQRTGHDSVFPAKVFRRQGQSRNGNESHSDRNRP